MEDESQLKALRDDIRQLAGTVGALATEVGNLRVELVALRERSNPVIENFYKAIGFVVVVIVGAVLALVIKDAR